jgi:lipid-A-disaccharide synthase
MDSFDIIIVTNSAGELSALVRPAVEELAKSVPQGRIILTFTPCQYATGRELEEARSFPGISEIIIPEEYKRWILKKNPPQGIKFNEKGVVLYMGGDLLHAVILSKKLKYPAIAYSQKHALWQNDFKSFLVPDNLTHNKFIKKGVSQEKLKIVGDLMVDSVPEKTDKRAAAARWNVNLNHPIISFLPGSRPFQIDYMLPFFLKSAKMIQKIIPETQFLFIISPYVTEDGIRKALRDEGILYSQGDRRHIQAKSGVRAQIIKSDRHDAISLSTLTVTIPGTNTAEIAALGAPMIAVFPLDRPDSIPLEGIFDWICKIPGLGILLKRVFFFVANKRTKFFTLPNMKTDKDIVPELRGKVEAKEVAARAIKLIKDPSWLSETSEELKRAMGGRGAAKSISEEIIKLAESRA